MSTDTPNFNEAKFWILSNAGAIAGWLSIITSRTIFNEGPVRLHLLPLVLNVCGICFGALVGKYLKQWLWMVGNLSWFLLAVAFGLLFLLSGTQWICDSTFDWLCVKLGNPVLKNECEE